jgi:PAS domain S-box-containing protein
MKNWIYHLLTPPRFDDPEATHIARLLHFALLTTIALNLIIILMLVMSAPATTVGLGISLLLLGVQLVLLVVIRRGAEATINTHQENAREFQDRLMHLHGVSVQLTKAASLDDLCRTAVELGRKHLGYDRLGILFLEPGSQYLVGTFGTDEHGQTRDERDIRIHVDTDTMVKRAIQQQSYAVVEEDAPLTNHHLQVVGRGWNAMAVLRDGDQMVGWISADNLLNKQPLKPSDLEILKLYGTMLGHLSARKRQEEQAAQFQKRLKTLHEVSLELTRTNTLDDLCRATVELGRSQLGFDRVSIWLLDQSNPDYMVGTFGTDENGFTRDERGIRLPVVGEDDYMRQAIEDRSRRVILTEQDEVVYNDRSQPVGRGQRVAGLMWDGDLLIGYIAIDNLLTKAPITPETIEILMLYSALVGHLCSRRQTEENTQRFQMRLKTLHEVSIELTKIASFDEMCRAVVELGRGRLGFDRLGLWFLDQTDRSIVVGSFGTGEDGQIRDERNVRLPIVGQDGPLMQAMRDGSRRIILPKDDEAIYDDRSQVVGRGQRAMSLMWDGDLLIGYIATDNYFHKQPITPDDIEILMLYSAMIAHLSTRKRAEEALTKREREAHAFQERLRVLHQVGLDLTQATSFDDLCYRAIAQGREQLGFDRLGMWFMEEDPAYMRGSFGIDEQGFIRDERMIRLPVNSQDARVVRAVEERVSALLLEDAPISINNDPSRIVGQGTKAMALLWEGDHIIGTISTDNLLSGQPVTKNDLEILTLYGSMLGHLAAKQRAEEALREERNLLRTIIDTVLDYVYVKDTESRFILINRQGWMDTPGMHSEQDMIGLTDFDHLPYERAEQFYEEEQELFRTGQPILNREEIGRDRDGEPTYLLTSKIPLRDNKGNIVGLVGVTRDVTERKQAEQERLELELQKTRVNLLTEFIGNMSHDLKTPLSVIKTSLYLLERLDDPARQHAKIETMKEQILLLEKLIQDVLTMSRLEHSDDLVFAHVDLSQLLRDVATRLHPAAERKNIQTFLELASDVPCIKGSEDELWRMMTNLVENALNYTPENGRVTLRTTVRDCWVIVEIIDTGIGISAEDLPRIFDRFYRADHARSFENGGTGLGLAIVKRIVDMHGGQINVESTSGQGTTFRVTLPISE